MTSLGAEVLAAVAEDDMALFRDGLLLATLIALPRELLGRLDTPLLPDQAPLAPVVVARSANQIKKMPVFYSNQLVGHIFQIYYSWLDGFQVAVD